MARCSAAGGLSLGFTHDSLQLTRAFLDGGRPSAEQAHGLMARLISEGNSARERELCLAFSRIIQNRLACGQPLQRLVQRLQRCQPIHVLFINDNGVYAGAGIALGRQAEAFALQGHSVTIVALNSDLQEVRHCLSEFSLACRRKHLHVTCVHGADGLQTDASGQLDLREAVDRFLPPSGQPTLVVLGNLHAVAVSPAFICELLARQCVVAMYAHDPDWVTGGCAYPQYHACSRYLTGCSDEDCPKPAAMYPQTSAGMISQNYLLREVLMHLPGLLLFTNSSWSSDRFRERYPWRAAIPVLLGLDTSIFRPDPAVRVRIRRSHGIDPEAFVIAVGADSLSRPGKGGAIVERLARALERHREIVFLSFGHASLEVGNIIKLGYSHLSQDVAAAFQAADVFFNPATIESFGQTAIEASACGCPTLALRGSGLDDAVEHGVTGLLLDHEQEFQPVLLDLMHNPEALQALSRRAVERSAQRFSLQQQYVRWIQALTLHSADPQPEAPPEPF